MVSFDDLNDEYQEDEYSFDEYQEDKKSNKNLKKENIMVSFDDLNDEYQEDQDPYLPDEEWDKDLIEMSMDNMFPEGISDLDPDEVMDMDY